LRPEPLLNGHDLMQLGMVPGPGLGQLADQLYMAQLEGILTSPEQAKVWARQWMAGNQKPETRDQRPEARSRKPEG
jgi:hypothetical protein